MRLGPALDRGVGLLLALAVLVWVGWLWHAHKTLPEYLIAEARRSPPLPLCRWTPIGPPGVVSIGMDTQSQPVWSYAKTAYLAFRTGAMGPRYLAIRVITAVGTGVTISADGSPRQAVPSGPSSDGMVLHLPLADGPAAVVHLVTVDVAAPRPPQGKDQRWLGVAVSGIAACGDPQRAPTG